jgi:hypothetical protein
MLTIVSLIQINPHMLCFFLPKNERCSFFQFISSTFSQIFHWSMLLLMIGIGEMVSCAAGANFTPHVISVAPGEVGVYC